jgi:hypothetical protein
MTPSLPTHIGLPWAAVGVKPNSVLTSCYDMVIEALFIFSTTNNIEAGVQLCAMVGLCNWCQADQSGMHCS